MRAELQEQLYEKYPKLFGQKGLPPTRTCMSFGICCGDGWYDILDTTCKLIQNHVTQERKRRARALRYNRALARALQGKFSYLENWLYYIKDRESLSERIDEEIKRKSFHEVPEKVHQVEFVQIKEKFGGLRIYCNYYNDYIDGVINFASSYSYKTCEICGAKGSPSDSGWIKTMCEKHREEK